MKLRASFNRPLTSGGGRNPTNGRFLNDGGDISRLGFRLRSGSAPPEGESTGASVQPYSEYVTIDAREITDETMGVATIPIEGSSRKGGQTSQPTIRSSNGEKSDWNKR